MSVDQNKTYDDLLNYYLIKISLLTTRKSPWRYSHLPGGQVCLAENPTHYILKHGISYADFTKCCRHDKITRVMNQGPKNMNSRNFLMYIEFHDLE